MKDLYVIPSVKKNQIRSEINILMSGTLWVSGPEILKSSQKVYPLVPYIPLRADKMFLFLH